MFNFIAVFCALLILLSGCQAHMGPARIQQQSINAALFSCSTLESCEMYAGAPEQKWKIFYLRDSVWEPGLVETATVPGRIIWRERVTKTLFKEHRDYVKTWHLLDGRLYKYEASSEPLLAGWKSIETCLNGRIVDVFFLGERGWVISEKGAIGITSNSGKQWKSYQLGFDGSFAALFFLDDSNGWVVMNSRTVLTTRDGGVTWGRIGDGFPETRITQLHFDDLNRGWAVAQGYKSPLFTSDGGKTWSMPDDGGGNLESIYYFDETHGWAIRPGAGIVHTIDGGKTWLQQEIEYPWLYNNPAHYTYQVPLQIAALAYVTAVTALLVAAFIVIAPIAYVGSKFTKPAPPPCENN